MAETESSSTTSNQATCKDVQKKRKPGRYLNPFSYEVDGHNGIVTWYCRIEEVDENGNVMQGPVQQHGIDTPALNRHHKGKHINFLLNQVKPAMLKHYEDHRHDHTDASQLKGQSL